jgi:hypothetical protein
MAFIHERLTRVIKTLAPGQPGTLKLIREHGETLVCVRYRMDQERRRRYTTVELIVEAAPLREHRAADRKIYAVRTRPEEKHLRAALQAMGAKWNSAQRHWITSARVVRMLDLQDRARLQTPSPAHPSVSRST